MVLESGVPGKLGFGSPRCPLFSDPSLDYPGGLDLSGPAVSASMSPCQSSHEHGGHPKQPGHSVMVIKITPEPTFLPVMAMEAISELLALPVLASIQWHHIVVALYIVY